MTNFNDFVTTRSSRAPEASDVIPFVHAGVTYKVSYTLLVSYLNSALTFPVSAADLTAEAATRASADTTLQTNITSEASTRASADTTLQTNITNEASSRASADTTLQTNITSEASTRASADTTLQANITSEASTRASADTTLQANINAEAATRASADTTLQTNINAKGDASGPASSVDSEVALFSGTGGKTLKRASTTGIAKLAAGVLSAATAGTDYADLAFKTIAVSGQSDVVADSAADTLTLIAGSNVTITTNAAGDTITFAASGGGSSDPMPSHIYAGGL